MILLTGECSDCTWPGSGVTEFQTSFNPWQIVGDSFSSGIFFVGSRPDFYTRYATTFHDFSPKPGCQYEIQMRVGFWPEFRVPLHAAICSTKIFFTVQNLAHMPYFEELRSTFTVRRFQPDSPHQQVFTVPTDFDPRTTEDTLDYGSEFALGVLWTPASVNEPWSVPNEITYADGGIPNYVAPYNQTQLTEANLGRDFLLTPAVSLRFARNCFCDWPSDFKLNIIVESLDGRLLTSQQSAFLGKNVAYNTLYRFINWQ